MVKNDDDEDDSDFEDPDLIEVPGGGKSLGTLGGGNAAGGSSMPGLFGKWRVHSVKFWSFYGHL